MEREQLYDYWFSEKNSFYADTKRKVLLKSQFNPIKENLYTWTDDKGYGIDICFLLSGRERAKSYRVTADAIADAFYSNGKKCFAYVRRFAEDVKDYLVEDYFTNHFNFIKLMSDGKYNCVICSRTKIYLSNNEDDTVKKLKIGRTFSINKQASAKSLQYPEIYNMIFEEVLTDTRYVIDECRNVHNLISTIGRGKEHEIKVWLVANTICRINPYVDYFALDDFNRMKAGEKRFYKFYRDKYEEDENGNTIELYYNICVYYLEDENADADDKTKSIKSIESNKWQEKSMYPHMNLRYARYYIDDRIPPIVFSYKNGLFIANLIYIPYEFVENNFDTEYIKDFENENNYTEKEIENGSHDERAYIYIQRKTMPIKKGTRIITNDKHLLLLDNSSGLDIKYKLDLLYLPLIEQQKIIYADNLTANEFSVVYDGLQSAKFD